MKWQTVCWRGIAVLAIAVGLVGGWYTLAYSPAQQGADPLLESKSVSEKDEVRANDRVTLSAAKLEAARIRVERVAFQEIPDVRTLPGRLQYDDRRHAKVRAAGSGVVVAIHVKPGDQVTAGQSLAVLSSPDVGEARADALKRQAERDIARRKHQRELQIESNLKPFVTAIQQRQDIRELRDQFRSKTLGEYREELISAYARFVLADSLVKSSDPVATPGILAGRTVQERITEQQKAEAALLAACEQATFDAGERRALAELNAVDGERRADISQQHLRMLLGYDPADHQAETTIEQDLSLVDVKAPFGGTIEQRNFSASERVQPNDELFVLADTTTLWIVADAREQDWKTIDVQPGGKLSVRVPAIPNRQYTASVHFIGREVSAVNNAVSIVAEIDNSDGALRPGLFMQAELTVGPPTPMLAVPSTAVVANDQQSFVFVQEKENTFRRIDVETGRQTDDWTEIRTGLGAGDSVVTHGAFLLKSELLLESEE